MAKGGKKSLRATLSSQQTRLKKNAQAKEAAQVADHRQRAKNAPRTTVTATESAKGPSTTQTRRSLRSTIPFRETDRILLVGEGDFSFARALVMHPPLPALVHLPPVNVVATAYDSEDACYAKYPGAAAHVAQLRDKGAVVVFGVDATALDKCAPLKGRQFDRVVWNFPHAGKGIADQDRNIRANQEMLLGFLRAAPTVLAQGRVPQLIRPKKRKPDPNGEDRDEDDRADDEEGERDDAGTRGTVLVTLRNVSPYTDWDLPKLAKNPPIPRSAGVKPNPRYTLLRSFAFHRKDWRGYAHRMTKGERAHRTGTTGQGGEDRTWEFCLRDEED